MQSVNSIFSYNYFSSVAFFGFYAYFCMKKAISKLL